MDETGFLGGEWGKDIDFDFQLKGESKMAEQLQYYINVVLEEYKTLREESKQASINMFTSLSIGLGIVGVIIAGAFSIWNSEPMITLIALYFLIPIFILTATFLWLGEAMRFKRAGDYLCLIEAKLSMFLQNSLGEFKESWHLRQGEFEDKLRFPHANIDFSDALGWEQWLRDMIDKPAPFGHLALIYKIRLGFFMLIFSASFATGVYLTFASEKWSKFIIVIVIFLGLIYLGAWIFIYFEAKKLHNKPEPLLSKKAPTF